MSGPLCSGRLREHVTRHDGQNPVTKADFGGVTRRVGSPEVGESIERVDRPEHVPAFPPIEDEVVRLEDVL